MSSTSNPETGSTASATSSVSSDIASLMLKSLLPMLTDVLKPAKKTNISFQPATESKFSTMTFSPVKEVAAGNKTDEKAKVAKEPAVEVFPNSTVAGDWNYLHVDTGVVDNRFYVATDIPGVHKKDVKVSRIENKLTITVFKEGPPGNNGFSECLHGHFQRTVSLPGNIVLAPVDKQFENGRLVLWFDQVPAPECHEIEL
jgi:HSP20 family molecular chaperone IbpA